MELISIILPVFNSDKYLAECLDSILAQTYTNYEICIVNDGSTDRSEEILKDYGIKYVNTKNMGEASARNKAIKMSKGDYLAIMDSDDIMMEDRLKQSLSYIRNYDVVYSGYLSTNEKSQPLDLYNPPQFNRHNFEINQVIPHSTMMIRKDKMIPYRDFKFSCDFALIWDLVKSGCRFREIPEPLIAYRISPQSMSSRFTQKEKDKWKDKITEEMSNVKNIGVRFNA